MNRVLSIATLVCAVCVASPMIPAFDKDLCCDDMGIATCKPLGSGTCNACKNCKYCANCAINGRKCSVCAKETTSK